MAKVTGVQLDLTLVGVYKNKAKNARDKGHAFELTYAQFRSIMTKTKCAYTGIKFTPWGETPHPELSRTLERIDNSKGYIKGNCVCVSYFANQIKSHFENPKNPVTVQHIVDMGKNVDKVIKKSIIYMSK